MQVKNEWTEGLRLFPADFRRNNQRDPQEQNSTSVD